MQEDPKKFPAEARVPIGEDRHYLSYAITKTPPTMNITFNELRRIKDTLPDGSIHRIARELELNVETVWNYFGGYTHPNGRPMGVHLEAGPDGGVVALDDTRILDIAHRILDEQHAHA